MTTPCVKLDEAKLYLRVDGSDDDSVISALIEAATGLAETRLRRATVDEVPADLRMAVCVIIAYWYENRTATDVELRDRVMRQMAFDRYIDWSTEDAD